MKINKILILVLMMALLVTGGIPGAAPELAYGATEITNPRDIVIAQPGLTYTTSHKNISIYGASDWEYPLTMNGETVPTTEHGFFAVYPALNPGENQFNFLNNGKTKTVTITYKPVTGGGTGGTQPPFDVNRYLYLQGGKQLIGTVVVNNGTRAFDNLESSRIGIPIAKGMQAQIIGEDKYFYVLQDYSFVYKSSMEVKEGNLAQNYVTKIQVSDNQQSGSAEVSFTMNVPALYTYTFDGNRMVLTLYGSQHWAPIDLSDNKLVSRITPITTNVSGGCAYEIQLEKGSRTNGVYIEFQKGQMILGFKKAKTVEAGSLKDIRIYLDAGHGGGDPGAMGALRTLGPTEKDINLAIAKVTEEYLKQRGAEVITTRQGDTEASLAQRMALVTEHKPDLSLSIHSNSTAVSNNYGTIRGYRTYYTFELPVTGEEDAVSFISRRTAELAGLSFNAKNRSNLALARTQYCPAMIFEIGFMSNPEDYEWLLGKENQEKVGRAIGQATLEWFEYQSGLPAYDMDSIKVFVNGEKVAFDVEPFIESGRTLVPIRRIFEALGGEVTWNEEEKMATVVRNGLVIKFKIGDNRYMINDTEHLMEVTARITEGGRTVVPLRVLSEALGYQVDWEEGTRTVFIR